MSHVSRFVSHVSRFHQFPTICIHFPLFSSYKFLHIETMESDSSDPLSVERSVTIPKPWKRRQYNLATIVSMRQIGSKSADPSLNEWLISRSMTLLIDEKRPESLKREREELHRCPKYIWDDMILQCIKSDRDNYFVTDQKRHLDQVQSVHWLINSNFQS